MWVKLSDASKESAALTAALNKSKVIHLNVDITMLLTIQADQIKAIALDHGHKPSDIMKIVNSTTNYFSECSASIGNALVHKKGLELNKGIYLIPGVVAVHILKYHTEEGVGKRFSLCDIQKAIADDIEYQNTGKADKTKAVDVLNTY